MSCDKTKEKKHTPGKRKQNRQNHIPCL